MKAHFATLPPPGEIANAVMQQLRTLGVYAAAALEELRADIMAALERLYAAVTVRQITYGEAEAAVQQAVERPADATSSASSSAPQNNTETVDATAAPSAVTAEVAAVDAAAAAAAAATATAMVVDVPTSESQPSLLDAASSGNATTDALTTPRSVALDVVFDELNDSIMPMAAPSVAVAVAVAVSEAVPAPAASAEEPAPATAPAVAAAAMATTASLQTSVDSMDLVDTDDFVVVGVAPSTAAAAAAAATPVAEAMAVPAPATEDSATERAPAVVPVPVTLAAAPEPTAAASPLRLSGSLILPSVRPRTGDATQPAGAPTGPYAAQVAVLREMGFPHGTDVLVALLEQVHGNIDAVIDRL